MKWLGRFAPRRWESGEALSAAQSSGEWPGVSWTFRDFFGRSVEEGEREEDRGGVNEGAIEVLRRTWVTGTRRDEAAEGGGRRGALFDGRGTGGADIVEGFRRGGGMRVEAVGFEGGAWGRGGGIDVDGLG